MGPVFYKKKSLNMGPIFWLSPNGPIFEERSLTMGTLFLLKWPFKMGRDFEAWRYTTCPNQIQVPPLPPRTIMLLSELVKYAWCKSA